MAGNWRKWGLAVIAAIVIAYAWIDGGSEDLEQVTVPVAIAGDPA